MLSKKILLPSLAAFWLFNGLLGAEETTQEQTETSIEGHVPVRSREMDPAKREFMQRLRAGQDENQISEDKADAGQIFQKASSKMSSLSSPFKLASAIPMMSPQFTLASTAFPINCHWLCGVADNGKTLELEDGSHWEISPFESYILRSWRREDAIVVTPNHSWFSSYDYYITNKSNNSVVKANLYVGPIEYGAYSHWIVNIDYLTGYVFLENQMIWCVNPQDSYLLKDWSLNDHVIFGLNDTWFTPFDHILINVNMDNNIRVKQY